MTSLIVIIRSLRYYWKTYLGLFGGAVLGAAVLCGALCVGDSVRYSLRHQVDLRLGAIGYALAPVNSYVREELSAEVGRSLNALSSAVLHVAASANTPDEANYSGRVNVYGVDSNFWSFWDTSSSVVTGSKIAVNSAFSRVMRVKKGDAIILRMLDSHRMPGDIGLSGGGNKISMLVTVAAIFPEESCGSFSLHSEQVSQPSVFMSLDFLQHSLNLDDRANVILLSENSKSGRHLSEPDVSKALNANLRLPDIGVKISSFSDMTVAELTSRNVFISPVVENAVEKSGLEMESIFTYFVNSIFTGKQSTPYSFVTGVSGGKYPQPDVGKIVLTDWLADDLGVTNTTRDVWLKYYVLNSGGELIERKQRFDIAEIIPMDEIAPDNLMPEFPGFNNAESCAEWDPDLPVDLKKIRDKDERYWEKYKGTPKAFVNISDARSMWSNRYGTLTSIRMPLNGLSLVELERKVFSDISAKSSGLFFMPVRSQGVYASANGVDFGQLFIGLSFFIILSAVILATLFFAFSVDYRREEVGTLYALGLPRRTVLLWFFAEGIIVAFMGALCGGMIGVFYCRLIINFLQTYWQGAIGQTLLWIHIEPVTLGAGLLASFLFSLAAIYICLRRMSAYNLNSLLHKGSVKCLTVLEKRWPLFGALICLTASVFVVAMIGLQQKNIGAFFGAGSLALAGCLLLIYWALCKYGKESVSLDFYIIVLKQLSRNCGRTIAAITLLSCGAFCVISVGVNRSTPSINMNNNSGTGGYSLYMDTTLPLPCDVNSPEAMARLGLDKSMLGGAGIVAMRFVSGDDASCLNLNRVQHPPLIGIVPDVFVARRAFTFAKYDDSYSVENPWDILKFNLGPDTIPAVADQAVIQWGLGLSIGDEIEYTAESGKPFRVKLVGGIENSVFQGRLLVDGEKLLKYFPSLAGANVFLIDTDEPEKVSSEFRRRLSDYGVNIQSAVSRLEMFSQVENTYLTIFLLLGGLGLSIGVFGLGVMLMRSALERRNELAMLRAVGYSRRRIFSMLSCEHLVVAFLGLLIGGVASLPVALPVMIYASDKIPYSLFGFCLLLLVFSSFLSTYFAVRFALSGTLISALRDE